MAVDLDKVVEWLKEHVVDAVHFIRDEERDVAKKALDDLGKPAAPETTEGPPAPAETGPSPTLPPAEPTADPPEVTP